MKLKGDFKVIDTHKYKIDEKLLNISFTDEL